MRVGFQPMMTELSVGGAYYMRNRLGRLAAVFKPCDEEPFAVNNPRAYTGSSLGMKNGIPSGEAGIREAAAFIIDNGFAGGEGDGGFREGKGRDVCCLVRRAWCEAADPRHLLSPQVDADLPPFWDPSRRRQCLRRSW